MLKKILAVHWLRLDVGIGVEIFPVRRPRLSAQFPNVSAFFDIGLGRCSFREISNQNTPYRQQPTPVTDGREKDVLTEKLQNVKSVEVLMDVTKSHHAIMNNKHLLLTFDVMNRFLRNKKNGVQEEVNSTDLNALCRQVVKRVRHFNPEECISLLKTLTRLNVPTHSAVVQSICQMIRHSINDLQIDTLTFLYFLLSKHSLTPLTDALKLAIPVVIEARLPTEMNPNNVLELFHCLTMIAKYNPSSSLIEKLCKFIIPRCHELNVSDVCFLISTLNELPEKPANYQSILSCAIDAIKNNFNKLTSSEWFGFLYQIHKYPELSLSSPGLLTVLSHEAKKNYWDLSRLSNLVGIYTKYHFISMEVLDLLAQRMSTESDIVASDGRISILNIAEAFSQADYLPGPFLHAILDSREKLLQMQVQAPNIFIKLVSHLAILDIAPPQMVEAVCRKDFIVRAYDFAKSRGRNKNLLSNLNILNQYTRLHLQNYNGEMIRNGIIEEDMQYRAEASGEPADPVLQNFLEMGLGGPQFVLHGLWTRLGHFIDHVIVMRKGDFPVAINNISEDKVDATLKYPESKNGFRYIEDLVIPDDAKILAVLVSRKNWMARDPPKLKGWATFQQRSLSKMGYNAIILGPPTDEISPEDDEWDNEGF